MKRKVAVPEKSKVETGTSLALTSFWPNFPSAPVCG